LIVVSERFDVALDRHSRLEAVADKVPILGNPHSSEHLHRALLVAAGPSDELDQLFLAPDPGDAQDQRFALWSAARLLDGPTWRALTRNDHLGDDPQPGDPTA